MSWLARSAAHATRAYFEMSYRSLTGSPEGRWFLEAAASMSDLVSHGYSTREDIDALLRAFDDEAGGHLLDLGCGLGHAAVEVHRRAGSRVTGIDISSRAILAATALAASAGVAQAVDFVQGSAERPPRVGATAAFALDSLMFVPVNAHLLGSVRDALDGRARLFATTLAMGRAPRDPVAVAGRSSGSHVVASEDVTDALVRHSDRRCRLARHRLRRGPQTARGAMALVLVVLEESMVLWLARRGWLRRWRTVVDLRGRR